MKDSRLIFLIIITLLLLCTYSYFFHNIEYPSIYSILNNPAEHEGKIVEMRGGEIAAINKEKNTFIYNFGKDRIEVAYNKDTNIEKSKFGKTAILGKIKSGKIELISLHNNNYNYWKYIISVMGFLILAFYMIKEWKLEGIRLSPKGDNNA